MNSKDRRLRIIGTEEPIKETWSMLSYFESSYNVEQYLTRKFGSSENLTETAASFALHMKAAREYFKAADEVTFLTRPLLMFYGMTALSKVLFMASRCKESPSVRHGVSEVKGWNGALSDFCVRINRDGTFPQFHGCYCKQSLKNQQFSLQDLLSLIPEAKVSFETVYNAKSRALKVERTTYGINVIDSELEKYENLEALVAQVPHVAERYSKNFQRFGARLTLICFNREADDPIIRSISGEEYMVLPVTKEKVSVSLPEMSVHFLAMYALGMLSRYPLKQWGMTLEGKERGDIYVIQKFAEVAKRKFPNLILNELHDRTFVFINPNVQAETALTESQLGDIYGYVEKKLGDDLRNHM